MKADIYADKALIAHMLTCISNIQDYTKNDAELFFQSSLIQDAVIRNIKHWLNPASG